MCICLEKKNARTKLWSFFLKKNINIRTMQCVLFLRHLNDFIVPHNRVITSLGRFFPGQSLFLMSTALSLSAALCMISVINHFDTLFGLLKAFSLACNVISLLFYCIVHVLVTYWCFCIDFFTKQGQIFSTSALLILV